MFTNFTHHQILQYTKDTKSDIHKISVTQIHTKIIHSRIFTKYCSMFHNCTGDQQFTSYKILSLLFPMMITIHQRNRNVSNNYDIFSKSAQNSLRWVLPDKYITDWLTIQLILSLLTSFSLFLPSKNKSLFKKNPMFCFHWWLTIHQWTEFQYPISTYVQISCVKYIPLLCWIWPDFIQKSSLFYQQSLGMIQTHVPNFPKSPYSLDDKIRTTVQLITYTVLQNCLSLFTISQITLNTVPSLSNLAQRLVSDFFLEGHHLSKIQLGANVTKWDTWYYLASFGVVEFCSFLLSR